MSLTVSDLRKFLETHNPPDDISRKSGRYVF